MNNTIKNSLWWYPSICIFAYRYRRSDIYICNITEAKINTRLSVRCLRKLYKSHSDSTITRSRFLSLSIKMSRKMYEGRNKLIVTVQQLLRAGRDSQLFGARMLVGKFQWKAPVKRYKSGRGSDRFKTLRGNIQKRTCRQHFNQFNEAKDTRGGGYLGQLLLGMCCWPLRTPTPL